MTDDDPLGRSAIHFGPGAKGTISDVNIVGFPTGISAAPGAQIASHNVQFQNVDKNFDLREVSSADISGARNVSTRPSASTGRSFIGWRNRHGAPLPSYCQMCDNVFLSSKYEMSGVYFSLWDNEDTCPNCGNASAKLSEGHFRLMQEAVHVITAPDISRQMVSRIATILADASNGRIPLDDAVVQIERSWPALAVIAKKMMLWGMAGYGFLSSIIGTVDSSLSLRERFGTNDQTVIEQRVLDLSLKLCRSIISEHKLDQTAVHHEDISPEHGREKHKKAVEQPTMNIPKAKTTGKQFNAQHKHKHRLKQRRSQFGKSRTR